MQPRFFTLLTLLSGLAVVVGAVAPARADVVRLTSGGTVRGEVVSETRAEVVVRTAGGTTVIPRHEVESIERDGPADRADARAGGAGVEVEYQARLAASDARDPEARYALGLWLKSVRARALARREFEAAIALDPAHRFAREELAREDASGRAAGVTAAGITSAPTLSPDVHAALEVVRAGEPALELEAAWGTLDGRRADAASRGLIESALLELEREARRGVERALRRAAALTGRYDPQAGPDAVRSRTLARYEVARDAALAAVFGASAGGGCDAGRGSDVLAAVAQARTAHAALDALLRRDARDLTELTLQDAAALARALGPDRDRVVALGEALAARGLGQGSPSPAAAPALRALVAAFADGRRLADLAGWDRALAERVRDERVLARNLAAARAAVTAWRPAADELEQVRLTNEHRMALGRPALELDLRLVVSARGHSSDMARLGFFEHTSPVPGRATPGDRMLAAGYGEAGGENIACGVDSARAAHDVWVASPAHHRNLLDAGWRAIGVGRDGRLWTQNFGVTVGQ